MRIDVFLSVPVLYFTDIRLFVRIVVLLNICGAVCHFPSNKSTRRKYHISRDWAKSKPLFIKFLVNQQNFADWQFSYVFFPAFFLVCELFNFNCFFLRRYTSFGGAENIFLKNQRIRRHTNTKSPQSKNKLNDKLLFNFRFQQFAVNFHFESIRFFSYLWWHSKRTENEHRLRE